MSNAVAIHEQQPPRLPTMVAGAPIRAIVPQDFEGAWRIATAVVRAGMAPRGLDTVEKSMVAIMHGLEVGLTPMNALQSIAVVNGRPTVWGDGAIGLARGSGLLEWMDETCEGDEGADAYKAICLVKRKGEPRPMRGEFSVADAKRAGLWGKAGPWQQYPKRMLKMRARAFALRDGFADVLKGLAIKEEVEDYHNATLAPRDEPPAPPPAAQIEQASGSAPEATPAEDLVHVTEQPETVEWTEPEPQESAPVDEPPVPDDPPAPPSPNNLPPVENVTVTAESVDDFPGDKPLPKAADTGVPEFLDRRKHPELNAPANEVNVDDWLKGLDGALSGCESTEQLVEVQNKYQSPMKGKVSKSDFARSQSMVMEAFTRISEQDGE